MQIIVENMDLLKIKKANEAFEEALLQGTQPPTVMFALSQHLGSLLHEALWDKATAYADYCKKYKDGKDKSKT